MYHTLYLDRKPFDYGYQLTGDQLQVLAHAKKAHAPIGKGDITVRFEYVARVEPMEKQYWAEFPDLQGCVRQGKTQKEVRENAKEALAVYLGAYMLDGDTLPKPKYKGRKGSKKVKAFLVKLALDDIIVEDRMTPEEAAALQKAMHSRDPNDPGQI